jgi:NAD(P)-dependent dehydrogenase (short-subunit alcohol dehydrogenase family)
MLNNKVIVVTGGAGLVGKAFVKAIASNGGIAIIADISSDKGRQAKSSFEQNLQKNVDVIELDITDKDSIISQIEALKVKYGRIDALVNNAYPRNKNYGRHFFDVEFEDFNENVALHLGGYFNISKHFAQFFIEQGQGNIINISSIYGLIAPRFHIY